MSGMPNESTPPANTADTAAATVQCVALPGWVEHGPYSNLGPSEDAYTDQGIYRMLYDSQTQLDEAGYAQHLRTIQRIITRAGAERAAHFSVEFDPTFQHVEVHFIRVGRPDATIDHARPDAFQFLRREKQLEQLALNGRLTATLLIPYLRIDDVLEVSLTITTHHPILGNQYAGTFAFNALAPWAETRHRLRAPPSREVFQKPFCGPSSNVITAPDAIDYRWSLIRQARLENEELTPPWQVQVPTIQFSEFRDWNQVAQIFAPYYAPSELPASLAAEVDRIAEAFSGTSDRAAEWLRFVQTQLRYFAMTLGDGGLVPRDLHTIWTRRFGDCKDVSRVFVAGAHRLGIETCAALTSTTHGLVLNEFIPSPRVFNHCIVRLRIDGKNYWLDPTLSRQEGGLDVIFQPHSGWALPLTAETVSLEPLENDEPILYRHTEEVFRLGPKPESPAELAIRVHYFSFAADAIRHQFKNEGQSKLAEQVKNELRGTWPDLTQSSPMAIEDDLAANRLVAVFQYEIRNAWQPMGDKRKLGFKVTAGSIAIELQLLKRVQRRTDVFLGQPRKATWQARMLMPRQWSGNGWNRLWTAAGIRYSNKFVVARSVIHLDREMIVSNWSLPASEASSYQELVARARENVVTILGRTALGRIQPAAGGVINIAALKRRPLTAIWLSIWTLYILWFAFKAVFENN